METIKDIVSKKAELIKLKRAETKFADAWGSPNLNTINKSSVKKVTKADELEILHLSIIGNTYNWLDSHGDVHVKGCFQKSINENKKVFHLHDHEFKIGSQVGKIQGLEEKEINWSLFGVEKEGLTTSLVADTDVLKEMNTRIFKGYHDEEIHQHSVGMQYVKLDLAVKERNDDWEDENKQWDEIYPLLGNPEKADEQGYFWVVKEAKLIEISAVLMGSNSLTPTLENKQKPSDGTSDNEAAAKALRTKQFYINLNS